MTAKLYKPILHWAVRIMSVVVIAALALFPATLTSQAYAVPTFSISAVVPDTSVTIITANFPADTEFTVRMGAYGTLGVGGIAVATLNSGAGGAFSATFSIPASLAGSKQIAIRLESANGYYAYNWFYNSTSPTTPIPGYTGIPTFSITSVEADKMVTVQTSNLPPSQEFTVRMGAYGTYGLGGVAVATFNSGTGGSQSITFDIPASLAGSTKIAIRMDCPAGYYAYNWFWNNNTTTTTPDPVTPPADGYSGFPTFSITNVVADDTVTIAAANLPKDQDFIVRMGAFGTYGVGGVEVATFDSGDGGAASMTFDIPASLEGSYKIAIRMDSTSGSGLYAYNWFFNNTTSGAVTPPADGYTGYPTFSITAVVKDTTVTVAAANLPKDQNFSVRMGAYGTYAIGGVEVATFNSGAGGAQSLTFDIPASLAGSSQIAIRMDSTSGSGLFAYNWFWNNSTQ